MSMEVTCVLEKCLKRAVEALAPFAPAPSILDRYLALRELAVYPLFGDMPSSPKEKLKHALRGPALAAQAGYNDILLEYLRRELIETVKGPKKRNARPIVYLAPFDVLSKNGGAARVLGLAEALSEDRDVNIISIVGPKRQPEVIPASAGVQIYAVPLTPEFMGAVQADAGELGGAAVSLGLARYAERLPLLTYWYQELAKDACACILNQPYLFPLWKAVSPDLLLVYDEPDVNSFFTRRIAGESACMARVDGEQTVLESQTCKEAACIGMASVQDMDSLAGEQGDGIREKFKLVPNGISVDRAMFFPPEEASKLQQALGWQGPLAVFLGSPNYKPNLDAVQYIAEVLAPAHTGCTFAVVGMELADSRLPTAPSNMVFLGCVSEARKNGLLSLADFALAPIPGYDSGTSLKIAEYVARGKPVLASRAGRRGYETLGDLLPEVEMEDMEKVTGTMLADLEADRHGMSMRAEKARALLREQYDWKHVSARYRDLLSRLDHGS